MASARAANKDLLCCYYMHLLTFVILHVNDERMDTMNVDKDWSTIYLKGKKCYHIL